MLLLQNTGKKSIPIFPIRMDISGTLLVCLRVTDSARAKFFVKTAKSHPDRR